MQFNYIETMITTTDFLVGINDNGPEKFRANNLVITLNKLSNTMTSSMLSSCINNNFQLDIFDNLLEDEDSYTVTILDNDTENDIYLEKMDKKDLTSIDFSSIISQSFSFVQSMQAIQGFGNFGQWSTMAFGLLKLGFNIYALDQTIKSSKKSYEAHKRSVDNQIEELNEQIDANKEFIAQATERLNKNKVKTI